MKQILTDTVVVTSKALSPIAKPGDELPYLANYYKQNIPKVGDLVVIGMPDESWWMRFISATPGTILERKEIVSGYFHLLANNNTLCNSRNKPYTFTAADLKRIAINKEFTLSNDLYLLLSNDSQCWKGKNRAVLCNSVAILGKVLLNRNASLSQNIESLSLVDKISSQSVTHIDLFSNNKKLKHE